MFERRIEELKVLYLFLFADGKKSPEETTMFGDICKKYEIDKEKKSDVVKYCNEKLNEYKNADNPALASIKDVINTDQDFFGFMMKGIKDSKEMQISTLWNLMNLAYADKEFSEEEKDIIEFLVKQWKVDDKIMVHLTDSIETLNYLYNYKKWVNETIVDKVKRAVLLKEIRKDIKNILKSVEQIVEEIHMI